MTVGAGDDYAGVEARAEYPAKSAGWHKAPVPSDSSDPELAQAGWDVQIYPSARQIIRVACYRAPSGEMIHKEPDEVIWPTWPATIEDEAAVTTSPLADLQRYWITAGNRLRESAKWMATVLGAALASVIGTSPISGHSFQVTAALIGLAGLLCLGITMLLVLRVMQPPAVSYEEIEAADEQIKTARATSSLSWPIRSWVDRHKENSLHHWKETVESHPDLYLPCGVPSLGELRWSIGLEAATLVRLSQSKEDTSDPDAAQSIARAEEARVARLLELRTAAARITTIGEYFALQARSTEATYGGITFGVIGTALIVLSFAWPLKLCEVFKPHVTAAEHLSSLVTTPELYGTYGHLRECRQQPAVRADKDLARRGSDLHKWDVPSHPSRRTGPAKRRVLETSRPSAVSAILSFPG
jgi:hypothetical protein